MDNVISCSRTWAAMEAAEMARDSIVLLVALLMMVACLSAIPLVYRFKKRRKRRKESREIIEFKGDWRKK